MPQAPVYNIKGEEVETLSLSERVFGVLPKAAVIHQVFQAILANQRKPWAHTKNKGEVRGGGKKPWKQKGTGRARHGSIRSPIWAGGGITFGPRNDRNYEQKINHTMNRQAVKMCLSGKVSNKKLLILDNAPTSGKTSEMAAFIKQLPVKNKSMLLLFVPRDTAFRRAAQNIPKTDMVEARNTSVPDLLQHEYVLATKSGIAAIEARFEK